MPVYRTIQISWRGGRDDRQASISIVILYEVYRAYRSSAHVREVYYYNIIHDNSLLFRYVNICSLIYMMYTCGMVTYRCGMCVVCVVTA